ncbi:MAG TPA: FAD-binding oxidoreductase [Longimicrobiales bacterium]|nr:FAD-binding oxidoreductase [Longimicrobiales bacterium]
MSATGSLADILPADALAADSLEGWAARGRAPEAVVAPRSADEVASTLRWAAARKVGVLPIASGARFRGSPLERPYVVLSTRRLCGVESYEPADLTLTAGAGTPLSDIDALLRSRGQWLPFDPPAAPERSLGGLVARGESGPLWMGYGELRNHVLGLTAVTGDGRTLGLGGRVVKNVAGFDLLKPLVGSRGRLAVITSVCVRAFPAPAADRLLVLAGESARALAPAAHKIATAPVVPASCVLLEPAEAVGAGAALVVRLHGGPATVEADRRTLERHAGVRFDAPEGPAAERLASAARDQAAGAAVVLGLTVLPSALADALARVAEHLGRVELAADACAAAVRVAAAGADPEAVAALRDGVERLGGALSLEGEGADDALLAAASRPSEAEQRLIAGLERVFDPEGVFWPCRT